ncbi:MAG: hypothetical protein ABJA67_18665 [Chthonomonadales bacterium]
MSAIIRMVNRIRGVEVHNPVVRVSIEDRDRLENCWKAYDNLREI